MSSLRKAIEVIASFDIGGKVIPIRFRYLDDQDNVSVVSIDKIVKRDIDRFAGNKMLKFSCRSNFNEQNKIYEIRYEIDTCHWFLYTVS